MFSVAAFLTVFCLGFLGGRPEEMHATFPLSNVEFTRLPTEHPILHVEIAPAGSSSRSLFDGKSSVETARQRLR
jgi:hypothetical protein